MEDGRGARVLMGAIGLIAGFGFSRKGIRAIVTQSSWGHKKYPVLLEGGDAALYGWVMLVMGIVLILVGTGCLYMAYKEEGH